MKVHHIAFTVLNMDQSIQWYQEKFGFQVKNRYEKHGSEICILEHENLRLELFCYGSETKPLPDYRKDLMQDLHVVGTKHLSIEVENLEQSVKDLKEKGVEFVMDIDSAGFGGKYTFFKDCDGILIELFQS